MDIRGIHRLENEIKHYAWGSHTAIPELLGLRSPASRPWAEMWMGAYPGSASRVQLSSGPVPLDAFIAEDPVAVLGHRCVERFGATLPFLFKVLAAGKPLSIQAHPSLEQAREGFARENDRGVAIGAVKRNYRDANHKPELLCALTPFLALDRFRPVEEVASGLDAIGAPELDEARAMLGAAGLGGAFRAVMELEGEERKAVLARAAECRGGEAFEWVARLARAHPDDVGALAPIFLNIVELAPGEALYVSAGELHSYLGGTAIELMANSDNVLRGGLTTKHVDVPELLRTLEFESRSPDVVRPGKTSGSEWDFATPAEEFSLSRLDVSPASPHRSGEDRNLEILVCTTGAGRVSCTEASSGFDFERGTVLLVPAASPAYALDGDATLYKASAGPV